MVQTDVQFPSISSQKKGIVINPDTSVHVYFGPLEPWFDKTWRPGGIVGSTEFHSRRLKARFKTRMRSCTLIQII